MADNGDLREDLKVPDGEIGTQIKNDFENGRELLVIPRNDTRVLNHWYWSIISFNFSVLYWSRAEKSVWSPARPIFQPRSSTTWSFSLPTINYE